MFHDSLLSVGLFANFSVPSLACARSIEEHKQS